MIISHFTRLNSIFGIKGSIKHSVWMAEEKGKIRCCRWGKNLLKGKFTLFVNLPFKRFGLVVSWTLILIGPMEFNYTQGGICLNVCVFLGSENLIVYENWTLLPQNPLEQTPDRALSRVAVRVSVPRKRSKSSVALCSNHQEIYCPHDEQGERIKRTG